MSKVREIVSDFFSPVRAVFEWVSENIFPIMIVCAIFAISAPIVWGMHEMARNDQCKYNGICDPDQKVMREVYLRNEAERKVENAAYQERRKVRTVPDGCHVARNVG